MKIRTMKLLAKEGLHNVYKNKLMSAASILTVVAALFFLGIVLLIAINITSNLETMKRELEVVVSLKSSITAFEKAEVETYIEAKQASQLIASARFQNKEEARQEIEEFVGKEELLEGLTEDYIPEFYYLKLTDPSYSEELITGLKALPGITDVGYSAQSLERLEGFLKIFNYVIIAVLVVLMIVSVFLIANTIRLTVFARRKEIEIMKYVGALDSFIRWPFIVEGMLIGFASAVLSFFFISQAYAWLHDLLNTMLTSFNQKTLTMLPFEPVALRVFLIYLIFGVSIGSIGSLFSVRKHLNV